jgi:hypothetical protein
MKRFLRTLPFLACVTFSAVLFFACAQPERRLLADCKKLPGLPGPFDMALDLSQRNQPRILISSQERTERDPAGELMRRGAIFAVGLARNGFGPAAELRLEGRDDFPFHPLGLDLGSGGGAVRLYVINQALSDVFTIEVFRVERDRLRFETRLRSSLLTAPRDVAATGDGALYVINNSESLALLRWMAPGANNVVRFERDGSSRIVFHAAAPTSLRVRAGEFLLASAGDRVESFALADGEPAERLGYAGFPGRVSGLNAETDSSLLVSVQTGGYDSGASAVFRTNADLSDSQLLFTDEGALLSGISTAVVHMGRLYAGGPFESGPLSCALD